MWKKISDAFVEGMATMAGMITLLYLLGFILSLFGL